MSDDTKSALDELAAVRAALIAAHGGEGGMPPDVSLADVVEALAMTNRYLLQGWTRVRNRVDRCNKILRQRAEQQAGAYFYENGKWCRMMTNQHGVRDETVDELPSGSEQLFCWADVQLILDEYRTIRARDCFDISDVRHSEIVDEVRSAALDAEDRPMIVADTRYSWSRAARDTTGEEQS